LRKGLYASFFDFLDTLHLGPSLEIISDRHSLETKTDTASIELEPVNKYLDISFDLFNKIL
jgi:hypothetical protein